MCLLIQKALVDADSDADNLATQRRFVLAIQKALCLADSDALGDVTQKLMCLLIGLHLLTPDAPGCADWLALVDADWP